MIKNYTDYTSNELSGDKIKSEFIVNSSIDQILCEIKYMSLKDAIRGGAIALEKNIPKC